MIKIGLMVLQAREGLLVALAISMTGLRFRPHHTLKAGATLVEKEIMKEGQPRGARLALRISSSNAPTSHVLTQLEVKHIELFIQRTAVLL